MKKRCPSCWNAMIPDEYGEFWECIGCDEVVDMSENEKEYYNKKVNNN